jgi:hypothetical protein
LENCIVCTSPCEHETALCGDCWKNECPFPEIQCAECQEREEREEELEREYREPLRYIHDAGHGWMEVPTQLVIASGTVPSKYSYVDPDAGMTYLEEDCDLGLYLAALAPEDRPPITDVYINGDAWIRDLPRWTTHAEFQASQQGA